MWLTRANKALLDLYELSKKGDEEQQAACFAASLVLEKHLSEYSRQLEVCRQSVKALNRFGKFLEHPNLWHKAIRRVMKLLIKNDVEVK